MNSIHLSDSLQTRWLKYGGLTGKIIIKSHFEITLEGLKVDTSELFSKGSQLEDVILRLTSSVGFQDENFYLA